LIVKPGGVGAEESVKQQGCDTIADGIGTNDTMQCVGIVCVGKGSYVRKSGLVGVTAEKLIGRGAVETVPTEMPYMMAYHGSIDKMDSGHGLGYCRRMGKEEAEQAENGKHTTKGMPFEERGMCAMGHFLQYVKI
jgi:hypothetical protein